MPLVFGSKEANEILEANRRLVARDELEEFWDDEENEEMECPECEGFGDCQNCEGVGCEDCEETGDCPNCWSDGYVGFL